MDTSESISHIYSETITYIYKEIDSRESISKHFNKNKKSRIKFCLSKIYLRISGEPVPDEPLIVLRGRVERHVERLVEELKVGDVVADVEQRIVLISLEPWHVIFYFKTRPYVHEYTAGSCYGTLLPGLAIPDPTESPPR